MFLFLIITSGSLQPRCKFLKQEGDALRTPVGVTTDARLNRDSHRTVDGVQRT
ncbi:hypothetical protein UFOVP38_38 [uncultured Caudovirales phage]|uniref:Uncharacterized protein n=1 Tax=uncultured Caudovirales phage TaxID=2100421 RepID=A0A6J5T7Y7_9CAUD|nr:hypothetical protein UFOVP38_38 [uncultured Caudovirales phage]